MTKNDIINLIYTGREYNDILKKLCSSKPHFIDDLKQDLIIEFMNKDEELLQHLLEENKLLNYWSRSIKLNISSVTSRFYYKYRKTIIEENELNYYHCVEEEEEEFDIIDKFDVYNYVLRNNILDFSDMFIFNAYYKLRIDKINGDLKKSISMASIANMLNVNNQIIVKRIDIIKYKLFFYILNDKSVKLTSERRDYLEDCLYKLKLKKHVKNLKK